jgi:HEAT repeat protein
MKRFTFLAIIMFSVVTAPAAVAEDASADAARILRAAAEYFRPSFRAYYGQAVYLVVDIGANRELEEVEILERLADSERGKEVVAAACREALAGDDPVLKFVAFYFLSEIEGVEANAYLPDLYDSLDEGDVFIYMSAFRIPKALDLAPEEGPTGVAEELNDRLERDLASDDRAARLKAAKSIKLMAYEPAQALAARGMQSPDADVRRWCVMNLAYAFPAGSGPIEAALRDEDPSVRAAAARWLADVAYAADADFIAPLLPLLEDREVSVRRAVASSIASILEDEPAADKGVAKKLLKRLKAEGDGVTRCYLAEAYGAATAKEGYEKTLTDDGYWAFFAGEWREEDLESYYEEYEKAGAYGDLVPLPQPKEPRVRVEELPTVEGPRVPVEDE